MDSESEPGDGTSELEDIESDVETPASEAADLITSGRASISSAGSGEWGVSFDPKGFIPSDKGLVTAPESGSPSGVPDKRCAALHADEARLLAEYIPGPPRSTFRDRTRGEERRSRNGREILICFEELEAALGVEDEATL